MMGWRAVLYILLALVAAIGLVNAIVRFLPTPKSAAAQPQNRGHQVPDAPVNPNATPEARALLHFLAANYGKHILSGQQDMKHLQDIVDLTGKRPAVFGFDFMDYTAGRVARGASSIETDNALLWDSLGGIVTFAWHWNAPKDLVDKPGKEWYRGFYTEATSFDVQYAMEHPESDDYRLLLKDIDTIAGQLQILQDAHVPVLFRPLHEAEGGWFWWGAKGPEPCKKLYRLLYDRLVNGHRLNNLIWVWSSESPDWYPGDDVVDIVGFDSYPKAGDYGPVSDHYAKLVKLVGDRKLVALTENGPIPDPARLQAARADWSWFVTWGGKFLTDGEQNSAEHLKGVYGSPYVVTLDELPKWKTGETEIRTAPLTAP